MNNYSKIFSIFHAVIIAFGAYLVYTFYEIIGFPLFISILLAILFSILLGVFSEVLVFKRFRVLSGGIYPIVASIGLYIVFQNIISIIWGDDTKTIRHGDVIVGNQIIDAYITTNQIITILISIVIYLCFYLYLHFTVTGKSIRAVSSNLELCNIYGISPNKIILIAFALGSALASIAGILSVMDTNMTPTFGFDLLLYGVVAMIIGGVGSTRGLIAGSLLVATSQHLAAFYLDPKWMDAVTYIVLILFLIWRPLGFSGKRLKKVEV